ncbi:hypothetical protein BDZ45DRAFT_391922 [Acephala macrosclerotiorum]|nr:hypothetical protein BDZ45DRAFT_391922 [Acephala macrosclerotiorum]
MNEVESCESNALTRRWTNLHLKIHERCLAVAIQSSLSKFIYTTRGSELRARIEDLNKGLIKEQKQMRMSSSSELL